MAITATVFEAKTQLSELIRRAQKGDDVIITQGRERLPVARIEALHRPKAKRLGALLTPDFELGEAFWQPLPADWDGTQSSGDDLPKPRPQTAKRKKARR